MKEKNLFEAALANLTSKEIVQIMRELIDIPSPMGGEKALANYLVDRFRGTGLKVFTQEVEPDRPNVIGILKGTGGGPSLMYCGHMDTTWAGDEEGIRELGPGYKAQSYMDGDWIWGMGARNMKGGLASTIAAVESIAKTKIPLKGDLILACVVGETCHAQVGRFQGARYRGAGLGGNFMASTGITADMAVCPESTSSRISIASGGYVYLEIKTWGNPGSTYLRGSVGIKMKPAVDAIEKMFSIVTAIKDWAPKYRAAHKYMGEEATNAAIIAIEGGHPWRPSKVPPFCRLYLEVDTMPGQNPLDVIGEVETLLSNCRSRDPELAVELNVIQTTHGSEVSKDEYIVKALSKAHRAIHGNEPHITWHAWVSDTTALTRHGIPAICYGTAGRVKSGGAGYFPKEGEHSCVGDLLKGARVFVHLALDVCSKDRVEIVAQRPVNRGTVIL